MSQSLSPEITGSQCLCGCLSRMLQRRNRWNSRLPLLCSSSAVASTPLNGLLFSCKEYFNIYFSFFYGFRHNLYITLFVIAKPYRVATYNRTDIPVLMSLLAVSVSGNICILTTFYRVLQTLSFIFIVIGYSVPFLYMTYWATVYIKHFINQHCRQRVCEITSIIS